MTEQRTGYMFAGLPGSGKSTAADILYSMTGGRIIRAGDMIREMAARDGLEDPTSEELGNYAAEKREEDGAGFFGERTVGLLLRGEIPEEFPIIVDSVRHINGVKEFREYFDTSYLIWVEASTRKRYDRLANRGRDDEDEFSAADFMRRDDREWTNLGTKTIYESGAVDAHIENSGDKADLKEKLAERAIFDGR